MADSVAHNVESLFSTTHRDFLIRNNDHQVKIDSLKGKKLGIYFSSSWCAPCRKFTPFLVDVYNELAPKGDFEVIFVSADEDDESFKAYFSKMPWLAIPFSDSDTRNRLDELFDVKGIPHLVLLDESGKIVTDCGIEVIREYGVEGYPFSSERIQELNDHEVEAKRNQSLISILSSSSRDFVISSDGKKILISDLEGKTIGLYFLLTADKECSDFTPQLVEIHAKLKAEGKEFEVVAVPLDDDDDDEEEEEEEEEEESFKAEGKEFEIVAVPDDDDDDDDNDDDEEEESFKAGVQSLPWLSLPFKDQSCEKLARYFELSALPTLVIVGPDGKTLHSNVVEFIEEYGIGAYPFTPEKFAELNEIKKAKRWVCDGEVCFKA